MSFVNLLIIDTTGDTHPDDCPKHVRERDLRGLMGGGVGMEVFTPASRRPLDLAESPSESDSEPEEGSLTFNPDFVPSIESAFRAGMFPSEHSAS